MDKMESTCATSSNVTILSSLLPQIVYYQTNKTVQQLFHAQKFFPVDDIASCTLHLLYSISTTFFLFTNPTKMGAILCKHIEQAQPVIIEDKDTDKIDYDFQILSRINTPIITIELEDE